VNYFDFNFLEKVKSKMFEEKLLSIITSSSKLPKDLVLVVLGYTIIPPRKQVEMKYSKLQMFTATCYDYEEHDYEEDYNSSGNPRVSCNHKLLGKFDFSTGNIVDKKMKQFPEKCRMTNLHLTWEPSKFDLAGCVSCKSRQSVITKGKFSRACISCSKFKFCEKAKKDTDVCLSKYQCRMCLDLYCSHGFHNLKNKTFCNSLLFKKVCKSCGQHFFTTSLVSCHGRNYFRLIGFTL
jgi:hypothetical protein